MSRKGSTSTSPEDPQRPIHDIVGVGFGPSNLALAIALKERSGAFGRSSAVFLERTESFGWHRGMLVDDATMQISFLKDLVTLRNPASDFSFLCYLRERDRLTEFVNHKVLFPTRAEFHDYLEWVAGRLHDVVEYGTEVVGVRPVRVDGEVVCWDVLAERRPAERTVLRTRDLVVATGISPALPAGVKPSERVWHSAEFLDRLAAFPGPAPRRFAVVGAGQSAAEVTAHLHGAFPGAEVHAVVSRYGYSPADDSPFVNRVFDPAAVDEFFKAPPPVKQRFFDYHANTNYSVVDLELIEELYRRSYREAVQGRRRLHLLHMSQVARLEPGPGGVDLSVEFMPSGERTDLAVDVVVYATGYRPMDPLALLGDVADLVQRDDLGQVRVERDYRLTMAPEVRCAVYLQGGTEHTHGLSSSLLSNSAVRAGEIAESLAARSDADLARAVPPAAPLAGNGREPSHVRS